MVATRSGERVAAGTDVGEGVAVEAGRVGTQVAVGWGTGDLPAVAVARRVAVGRGVSAAATGEGVVPRAGLQPVARSATAVSNVKRTSRRLLVSGQKRATMVLLQTKKRGAEHAPRFSRLD
jgi:hypothetical protein